MALDSVPTYLSNLGSAHRTARTQQQGIRKDERTWTSDTYAPYDDGHQWRKYGEKKLSNSNFPRFYYRCTYKNDMKCPATKQVQQKNTSDPPLFFVTYFNHHTCSSSSTPIGGTRDTTEQSSSRKAVSICFSPQAASEQHAFLTSSALPQSPSIHSYRGNQQPEMNSLYEQERAPRPAARVLCRGHCCRSVSPDASSTSISCEAVHGRRRLYRRWWDTAWCQFGASSTGGNIAVPGPNYRDPTYRSP